MPGKKYPVAGITVARRRNHANSHFAAALGLVLAAALLPGQARAEGLLDFLFGSARPQTPPAAESYAEPSLPPVAPAPLGQESVRQSGAGTGRTVMFCVRLCDGQHFPVEHMANATPVETCRAMCPASKTKVFFGGDIGSAVAKDGGRYADLDNAFIYRKQMVPNCTCNGKDAFGLAPLNVATDPTLRPGDIIATKTGLIAYSGKTGNAASFTPVERASVAAQLNPVTRHSARPDTVVIEDDPGTITQPVSPPAPVTVGGDLRFQFAR
jgi:hypothetical protein